MDNLFGDLPETPAPPLEQARRNYEKALKAIEEAKAFGDVPAHLERAEKLAHGAYIQEQRRAILGSK